jgi:transcriptional regulator with XRE-family HTH domain
MKYARYVKKTYKTKATLKEDVLKGWLKSNDSTIDTLADNMGISSRTIKYWLKGRTVRKENRMKLCDATSLYPKQLFDFKFEH